MVARENYKRSASGTVGILACAICHSKRIGVSESREIAWVPYLDQIKNMDAVARENYKGGAPASAGILACAISYSKKVTVSESRKIAWVAYLVEITNIGSGHVQKF